MEFNSAHEDFIALLLALNQAQLKQDDVEIKRSLEAMLSALRGNLSVPSEWREPFKSNTFCSTELLCGCPAQFWKRLARQCSDETACLVQEVSEALADEDFLAVKERPSQTFEFSGLHTVSLKLLEADYYTGGVGRFAYPAAEALADLLASGRIPVNGDRVLELGCGIGLVGLAAAQCGAASVKLTDFAPAVLECAARNAKENGLLGTTSIARLDWEDFAHDSSAWMACRQANIAPVANGEGWVPDVILGADVCYSATHAEAMLRLISFMLSAVCPKARVIILNGWPNCGLARFEWLIGARSEFATAGSSSASRPYIPEEKLDQELPPEWLLPLHILRLEKLSGFGEVDHHMYELCKATHATT